MNVLLPSNYRVWLIIDNSTGLTYECNIVCKVITMFGY